ncbi:MAG: sugar phosphate isomerase/epimerase [Candidatus Solibacter sp.]|nr:sugar phosphate isomerase/epimerase [Candidatus Solibacter sp.]
MTSRREFLQATSLGAALSAAGRSAQLKTLAVQLYTVRGVLPQKPQETLNAIRDIGYQEVEATYALLEGMWPALQSSGLKPVSIHLDSAMVTKGKADDLSPIFDKLKQRGFQYAVMPYVPEPERGGIDVIKGLADKFNRAAEKCRAAGMSFCYHNHAFEFATEKGETLFQVLLDNTDKKLVGIELDTFWVSVAGVDPAVFITKISGRVPLIHVKDKAEGTPVMFKEAVPRTAFKEVGSGVMDIPKILRAAAKAGVKHYIVEQDQTPGDPVDSLRQSYAYLSKLSY